MDKEEFNQSEINKIPEFTPFKGEFFGVSEHSRPKMENYKVPEMANSSLPEKPIQENIDDGYSKKLRENAQGQGNSSGSSSGDSGLPTASGGSGGGTGSMATTTATTAGSSAAGASAGATAATAAGVGGIVAAAVVGGAALGVIPMNNEPSLNNDYGNFSHQNYESIVIEEDGQQYQLLTFNFEGEIKEGFKGVLINNKDGEIFEISSTNPTVEVKAPIEDKNATFKFEIHDASDERIVYSQDIVISEIELDMSLISLDGIYKTTYNPETNALNAYFYIDSNITELYPEYHFDKVKASTYDRDYNLTEFEATKIAESEKGFVYTIENYPLNTIGIQLIPYVNVEGNQIAIDGKAILEVNQNRGIYPWFRDHLFELEIKGDNPKTDVSVKVTHDDASIEEFVIPKEELTDGKLFTKYLNKQSDNPTAEISFVGRTASVNEDTIIPENLMKGTKEMPKLYSENFSNTLADSYGNFIYKNYEAQYRKIGSNPDVYEKDVVLFFEEPVYSHYYVRTVNCETGLEEPQDPGTKLIYNNVPEYVHLFEYRVYYDNETKTDLSDDRMVRRETIQLDDTIPESVKFKNYQISNDYQEDPPEAINIADFNFEGTVKEGTKATLENIATGEVKEITNSNRTVSFSYPADQKQLEYSFKVLDATTERVLYQEPITVEDLVYDPGYELYPFYKSTYVESSNTYNLYIDFDCPYFNEPVTYPFSKFIVEYSDPTMPKPGPGPMMLALPPELEVVKIDGYQHMYKIENIPSSQCQLIIRPFLEKDGNLFEFELSSVIVLDNTPNLNNLFTGQVFDFQVRGENPLSDVSVVIHHNDGTEENLTYTAAEVANEASVRRFLNGYSTKPKVTTTYVGTADSRDMDDRIPASVMVGSTTLTKTITEEHDNDPTLSYGDIAYQNYEVSYHASAGDPAVQVKDIKFLFNGDLNSNYFLTIVNPVTNTEVRKTTIGQVTLTDIPLDVHDFVVYIYSENWTPTEVDDYRVRKIDINVPDVPPTV